MNLAKKAVLPPAKFVAAALLLSAFFLRIDWLILVAFAIPMTLFFMTFGKFANITPKCSPFTRCIRAKMLPLVSKWDADELRFTFLFPAFMMLLGFTFIFFGLRTAGYIIVFIMAIFQLLSGVVICCGGTIYRAIKGYKLECPLCKALFNMGEEKPKSKSKKTRKRKTKK